MEIFYFEDNNYKNFYILSKEIKKNIYFCAPNLKIHYCENFDQNYFYKFSIQPMKDDPIQISNIIFSNFTIKQLLENRTLILYNILTYFDSIKNKQFFIDSKTFLPIVFNDLKKELNLKKLLIKFLNIKKLYNTNLHWYPYHLLLIDYCSQNNSNLIKKFLTHPLFYFPGNPLNKEPILITLKDLNFKENSFLEKLVKWSNNEIFDHNLEFKNIKKTNIVNYFLKFLFYFKDKNSNPFQVYEYNYFAIEYLSNRIQIPPVIQKSHFYYHKLKIFFKNLIKKYILNIF